MTVGVGCFGCFGTGVGESLGRGLWDFGLWDFRMWTTSMRIAGAQPTATVPGRSADGVLGLVVGSVDVGVEVVGGVVGVVADAVGVGVAVGPTVGVTVGVVADDGRGVGFGVGVEALVGCGVGVDGRLGLGGFVGLIAGGGLVGSSGVGREVGRGRVVAEACGLLGGLMRGVGCRYDGLQGKAELSAARGRSGTTAGGSNWTRPVSYIAARLRTTRTYSSALL